MKHRGRQNGIERHAFWEAWKEIFGPPAVDFPGHTEAAPAGIPSVGDVIDVGGQSARVLEVFRTARTRAQDGDRPPYGWRVRVLLEDGRIMLCKPAYETQ